MIRAAGRVKHFYRPCDVHASQFQIVGGMQFAIRALVIADSLELLVTLRVSPVTEGRHRRLGDDFDVIIAVINRERARNHGAAEGDVASSEPGVGGDVHFRDHLAQRVRNNPPHAHAWAEGEIGRFHPGVNVIPDQTNPIRSRTGLQRGSIDHHQRRFGGWAPQLHVEAEFLVFSPEPAALGRRLIRRDPEGFARFARKIVRSRTCRVAPLRASAPRIAAVDHAPSRPDDGATIIDRCQADAGVEFVDAAASTCISP